MSLDNYTEPENQSPQESAKSAAERILEPDEVDVVGEEEGGQSR